MRLLLPLLLAFFALPLAASMSGTVIDPDGLPVAGVRITASRAGRAVGSATTSANGAFELDAGDGFFELVAEKDGYARESLNVPGDERSLSIVMLRPIPEPPAAPRLDEPARSETITGIVRDEAKRPVAGIEVTVQQSYWSVKATTGAKGDFVANVAPGECSVSIEGDYLYSEPVKVRSGGTCELIAKRTSSIDGVLLDYDGRPVRGARVELLEEPRPGTLTRSAVTDVAGRFRLRPRPDTRGQLIARKQRLPVTSLLLPELEKARHGITLKFPRGIELQGIVSGDDGRPVGGVSINQDLTTQLFTGSDWARTANDGTFSARVQDLPVDLHFVKDRYVSMTVAVDATRAARPLDVRLKQLQFIRGKVVRKDGTAVGGAIITAPDSLVSGTTSAANGSFELGFPNAGEFIVESGLVNRQQSVRAPADNVRLIYDEGLTIRGRVIDGVTGAPLDGTVELTPEADTGPVIIPTSFLAGQFSFAGFEPGTVTISVFSADYAPAKVKVDAAQTQPVVIALEPAVTLRGLVHDAAGKPVGDALIRGKEQIGQSDHDGRFEVKGFAPDEPAIVAIVKPGYVSQWITIAPQELGKFADILLPAGITVTGHVFGPDGKPAAVAVTARSTGHDAALGYAASGRDGQFEINGLSAARYDFVVEEQETSDLSGSLRDVDVEQVREITIQLHRPSTGVVTGRVAGIPASFTLRTILIEDMQEAHPVNPDGTFRVEGVPAGPATVSAMIDNLSGRKRSVGKTIEVPANGEASVELAFEAERVLTGRVMHRGRPVSGAHLAFTGDSTDGASADSDGHYEVRLEPGRYSVEVADRNYQLMPFRGEVDVERTSRYDITIDTSEIRVRVLDAETGQPLRNASVTFGTSVDDTTINHARTAADGVAVLEVAHGAKGIVWVYEDGYAVGVADTDDADITVKLVPAVDLNVRVVDARDGRTLEACVAAYDAGGRVVASSTSPDADGTASLNLRPGTFRVVASAEGYGSTTVRASAPASELRIGLQRGGTLMLRSSAGLQGTAGIMQPNGESYAWRCEYAGTLPLTGRLTTIKGIAPGSFVLEITPAGQKPRRYPVTVVEGTAVTVQID